MYNRITWSFNFNDMKYRANVYLNNKLVDTKLFAGLFKKLRANRFVNKQIKEICWLHSVSPCENKPAFSSEIIPAVND